MKKRLLLPLFLFLLVARPGLLAAAPAPTSPPAPTDSVARRAFVIDSLSASLRYDTGHITLPGSISELDVPRGFRYLDSAQSRVVLTRYWGNPDGTSLGMLFPADHTPFTEGNWAYVIEYDPSGHVKDDDAKDLNYDDLLKDMQEGTNEANEERTKAGYEAVTLTGWASPPYYDQARHTLHWAKLLRFGTADEATVNYNVRLLGRKGVLVLNAVGSPANLPAIKESIPGLLGAVSFAKGEQYTDFDAGIDEVAAYGIGGLIAGKVLAKVGLFALALKLWKLLLVAAAGAWAGVKRFLGGRRNDEAAPEPEAEAEA